jgi:integrase
LGCSPDNIYLDLGVDQWRENIEQARKHQEWGKARTVEDDLEKCLALYLDAKSGASAGHRRNMGRYIGNFISWLCKTEGTASAGKITALSLLNYRRHLMESGKAGTTTGPQLNKIKTFVRWLHEMEIIASKPRNLDSRNLVIPRGTTTPHTWTDEEIQLIHIAPDRIKLFMLLALNLGFYSSDIASLRHDMVDWDNGRIKAKRHKTGQGAAIWFDLWPETFRLLKQERDRYPHPELVLQTKYGKPLWNDADGRDAVAVLFQKWRKTHGIVCRFKDLRKTGRTRLDNHDEFARYAPWYLQHSPKTVDERYYRAPTQSQFSRALKWLGDQWGF